MECGWGLYSKRLRSVASSSHGPKTTRGGGVTMNTLGLLQSQRDAMIVYTADWSPLPPEIQLLQPFQLVPK